MDLLTDQSCGCGALLPIQPSPNPADAILVRSKPGITTGNFIAELDELGRKVYELQDFSLVKPIVSFSNNQSTVKEVGQTVATVIFSGNISAGSFAITSRSISPDPGGLDLTAPFSFQKTNVKLTAPGKGALHTVTAIDNQGNSTILESFVPFKHAFYQGANLLGTLDQAAIKALANKTLVDSIVDSYGGVKTYTVGSSPAGDKYIYWCGPVGTPVPVGAILNGLPVPLYFGHAVINVTNIYDGSLSIPYWVVRTANKFSAGTYLITMS